jgi:hypothetical protein
MGVTVLDAVNPFPFPVLDLTAPHGLVFYSLGVDAMHADKFFSFQTRGRL